MKKISVLALGLALIGSLASAQTTPPANPPVAPAPAPGVVIAGGLTGSTVALAVIPLALLAAVAGGGSSSSSTTH